MAGVDRVIRHYHIHHSTGERTLNTSFNRFLILNALAYVANLILLFTVGAFGRISSTTTLLAYEIQSIVTPDELFFRIVWGFIIAWQGFWIVWQIAVPSQRNCEGLVTAAYFYPFMIILYAGYTISCAVNLIILGCVFVVGVCGTLVGVSMSLQKYRPKLMKEYLLWQAPMTLQAAWMMIETMLMINAVFVVLDEMWVVKVIIASVSLVTIFLTAIAWLSSYPVDFMVPLIITYAIGGIYYELKSSSHYRNLIDQEYSSKFLEGAKYTFLACLILLLVAIFLKILVVIIHQRPREMKERKRKEDNRVSVNIVIDTSGQNTLADETLTQATPRRGRHQTWDENDDLESPPVSPAPKKKKKKSSKSFRDEADVPESPRQVPKKKKKKKKNLSDDV